MKIKIGNYVFGLLLALSFTASAQKSHVEWVKINPEKIQLAKNRPAPSDFVRQINLVLDLREKENLTYYTESNGFFAQQSESSTLIDYKSPLRKKLSTNHQKSNTTTAVKQNMVLQKPVKVLANHHPKLLHHLFYHLPIKLIMHLLFL